MKTLEQIKNEYSAYLGYMSWKYMLSHFVDTKQSALLNLHFNEVMKIYARECLKLASENVICSRVDTLVKKSITNENNIIK